MDKHNDIEFDLVELLLYIKKKVFLILAVVVLFALGGYLVTKLFIPPEYTAKARLYVYQDSTTKLDDVYSIQISTMLRRDFEVLITGKDVSEQVVEELGINVHPSVVSASLVVDSADSTRVMDLSYVDTDPQRAALILNKVCEVSERKFEELRNGEDTIKISYEADVPGVPSSPSPERNAAVGAIIGLAVILVILVIFYLMDDTIRTEEDVEKYMGLSTLSSVPICDELATLKRVGDNRPLSKKNLRSKR